MDWVLAGSACQAKWSDGHFYAAVIVRRTQVGADVTFPEYGENSTVSFDSIRPASAADLAALAACGVKPSVATPTRPSAAIIAAAAAAAAASSAASPLLRPPPPPPPPLPPSMSSSSTSSSSSSVSSSSSSNSSGTSGVGSSRAVVRPPPPPPLPPSLPSARPVSIAIPSHHNASHGSHATPVGSSSAISPPAPAPAPPSLSSSPHTTLATPASASASAPAVSTSSDIHITNGQSSIASSSVPPIPPSLSSTASSTSPSSVSHGSHHHHHHAHGSQMGHNHNHRSSISARNGAAIPLISVSGTGALAPLDCPPGSVIVRLDTSAADAAAAAGDELVFELSDLDCTILLSEAANQLLISESKLSSKYPLPIQYELKEEIGSGAFGRVHRAIVPATNADVAIKILDLNRFDKDDELDVEDSYRKFEETWVEVTHTRFLKQTNILRYNETFVRGQELWIVSPLCIGGSLANAMTLINPTGLKDSALVATVLRDIVAALCYLHGDGKIHKDLKADNILLSGDGDVILADFGVATDAYNPDGDDEDEEKRRAHRKATSFAGSPCWMAPEVMAQHALQSMKVDIWSFGITALEIAYGRPPYAESDPVAMKKQVCDDPPVTAEYYRDASYKFHSDFHKMVALCLQKDPKNRPTSVQLQRHSFFKMAKTQRYVQEKLVKEAIKRRDLKKKADDVAKKEEARRARAHGRLKSSA